MNEKQLERMKNDKGFIAALDQSGGSTPKALLVYGVKEDSYKNEDEMFEKVHEMRTRIITSDSFKEEQILAAILFEQTMDSKIEEMYTADYLWEKKNIVPLLKVDKGLADEEEGVQLMNPNPDLDKLLDRAVDRNIFGTKMRSVIKQANPKGIEKIVDQQFEVGKQIIKKGLIPMLEPEVDINSSDKEKSEVLVKEEILKNLEKLSKDEKIMLKLSIPSKDDYYKELVEHPQVIRVVALSGGYTREDAVDKLSRNKGLIASFSRALSEGLNVDQSDKEFDEMLENSIENIYNASVK